MIAFNLNCFNKEADKYNKRPFTTTKIHENKISALLDTGASISAMSYNTFIRLFGPSRFKQLAIPNIPHVTSANGQRVEITGRYRIPIILANDQIYNHDIFIVRNLSCSLILGMDFINKYGLITHGGHRRVYDKNGTPIDTWTKEMNYKNQSKNIDALTETNDFIPLLTTKDYFYSGYGIMNINTYLTDNHDDNEKYLTKSPLTYAIVDLMIIKKVYMYTIPSRHVILWVNV